MIVRPFIERMWHRISPNRRNGRPRLRRYFSRIDKLEMRIASLESINRAQCDENLRRLADDLPFGFLDIVAKPDGRTH